MVESDADCQLLFGLMAIQLRIVPVAVVSRGLAEWSPKRDTSLKQILIGQQAIDEAAGARIDQAVADHLVRAQGDPRAGLSALAATSVIEALRAVLGQTLKFARPDETTIAKHDLLPFPAVIPANGRSKAHEPPTRSDVGLLVESDRTITFDAAAPGGPGYQILRPLARGGLGEVFVARDSTLNREVALKLIQETESSDPQARARFLLEAEITGGLEHPGIVPVYALGKGTDGRPFYAMRLIRGETLKERIRKFHDGGSIRRQSLEFRQLLNHFVRVCDVVAYAHSRGVLHRDLKPSNVMVGKFGETLLVDWGLAKPIERSGETPAVDDELTLRPVSGSSVQGTLHGATMGTPQYMSPEQAMGQLDRIGSLSDVYSLGATLYCILTARPPLAQITDVGEVLRRVALGDIPPARVSKPDVPGTLEQICGKAMAVRPEDRYVSALNLAADIESWLADEPVRGVRESPGIRLGRWERRHRTFIRVSSLALIAVALVAIAAALGVNRARERAEDRRQQAVELGEIAEARKIEADRQRDALRRLTTRLTFDRGLSLLDHNDLRPGLLWLARSLGGTTDQDAALEPAIRTNLAAWGRSLHRLRECLEHRGPVRVVAWSPTGRSAVTGSDDGTAQLWDPVSGDPLGPPLEHSGAILAAVYSHAGKTIATASEDQTARLWNATSGLPRGEAMRHRGPVTALAFTPDGTTLITGSGDGTVRSWDGTTGQPRGQQFEHGKPVKAIAVAPDGKTLAILDEQGTVILQSLTAPNRRVAVEPAAGKTAAFAFSPDSLTVACGGEDGLLRIVGVSDGKARAVSKGFSHSGPILALAFTADGARIATGSYDTSCRLWSAPGLSPVGNIMEQRGHVWALAFNPAGTLLAVAADDNTAQIWDVVQFQRSGDPLPHHKSVRAVAFSADGRSLLTGCDDGTARLWQLGDGPGIGQAMNHSESIHALAARPDGKAIATASSDGTLWLWDALTTRRIARQTGHSPSSHVELLFDPTGTILISAAQDGWARRWNGSTLEPIEPPIQMTGRIRRLAISPDGGTLAIGDQNGRIGFYEPRTARPLAAFSAMPQAITGLAFNHDGTRLAVCNADGEARIWDVTRFAPIGEPMRHSASIHTATFSPDGTRLATASYDKTARIWDAATMKPIGQPLTHRAYVWSVQFSPDGKRILTGSFDGTAQVWDGLTGRPAGEPLKSADMIYAAQYNGDASMVLTFGRSPSARLWHAPGSRAIGEPLSHDQEIFGAVFLPGRPVIATASRDRTARLWSIPSPLTGDPARLNQEMTVLTGMELGDDEVVRLLDVPTWKARRNALKSGDDDK